MKDAIYESPLGTHTFMPHGCNAKLSGKSRIFTWQHSHTFCVSRVKWTWHQLDKLSTSPKKGLVYAMQSNDLHLQVRQKVFLVAPSTSCSCSQTYRGIGRLVLRAVPQCPHVQVLVRKNQHSSCLREWLDDRILGLRSKTVVFLHYKTDLLITTCSVVEALSWFILSW